MTRFGSIGGPPASFVLAGVRVVDAESGTDAVRDLAVLEGRLAPAAEIGGDVPHFDASGLIAAPAFCDLHTHLRQPGGESSETIESGTRAAAHGGYATVCAMPNTDPPIDEPARVAWVASCAVDAAARVRVVAAATVGRAGEQPVAMEELATAGVMGFSDDGASIASPRVARAVMSYLAPLGLPLIEHAEDPQLAAGTLMRGGPTATRLGLAGWPPSAELTVVERDIALAAETGAWLHLTHLSTAASLEAVRRAKGRGLRVTCDVTPHHLAMTDAWVAGDRTFAWDEATREPGAFEAALDPTLAYDGRTRVNPPLPARDDALALLAGVADGSVDAIATDHAPHPPERKAVEFANAAPGMIGLETALALGLAAVAAGRLELVTLIAALSTRPARLIGESRALAEGEPADLVVFDARATWRIEAEALASGSANTPLLGMELPGVVRMTVAGGRITYAHEMAPLA
ncbi:MAG TPA: dihydroorotase [Candidatus Limnocylindria bacterium]